MKDGVNGDGLDVGSKRESVRELGNGGGKRLGSAGWPIDGRPVGVWGGGFTLSEGKVNFWLMKSEGLTIKRL